MTAKPAQDWAVLWEPVRLVGKSPSCSFHLWLLQIRKQARPSMGRWHGNLQSWWKPVHWEVYRCLLNQFLPNRDKQGFSGDIKHFPLGKNLLLSAIPALMNDPFWYDHTHDDVWWKSLATALKVVAEDSTWGKEIVLGFTFFGGPGVPLPSSRCPQMLWDESPGVGWITSPWGWILQQAISVGMEVSRAGPYPWLRSQARIKQLWELCALILLIELWHFTKMDCQIFS